MQLYNLPLSVSTSVLRCVSGSFTSPKTQELVLAKSHTLQLYTISESGKLQLVLVEELFCIMRTLAVFRFQGTLKDMLAIGSDSGKLVILEFNETRGRFTKVHEETFGKSGSRRIVPGQYVAFDPRGRACMVAAVQKQKFVYVLERSEDKLLIHSPRDAHKSHSICVDLCALDTGSENAQFVCIQMDYGEIEDKEAPVITGKMKKTLVYYEMDFGMNTVIRKKEQPVDPTAHMLVPVPAGTEGPGGIMVLLEDYLLYRNGSEEVLTRFPRRAGRKGQKIQFTAYCEYRFKGFFFLIVSEEGDLFKAELVGGIKTSANKTTPVSIKIEYYCTISTLTSMTLSKSGFLFCASEREDHKLYNFGPQPPSELVYTHSQMDHSTVVQFTPRREDTCSLEMTDSIEQIGPITDLKIADLKNEGNPQLYTLSAATAGRSHLRIIKQGLRVKELRAIKYHMPTNIWCLKASQSDQHHRMIIMALPQKTLVLTMTPVGYSQTKDTGLEEDAPSIHVGLLEDDSIVQIISTGFRHIKKDKTARTIKFQGRVMKGFTKGRQMVIAIAGGDIIYYELEVTGMLVEVTQASLESEIIAFDFSPVEKGRIRSSFLAVGLQDCTTRILELNPDSCLKTLSTQNMKSAIESIAIEEMDCNQGEEKQYGYQLYLYAGLQNGMIIRTSIDTITGKLTDSRPKYLGLKPVKCVKMTVLNKPAILALSSRPWLIYTYGRKELSTLLAFPFMSVASEIHMPTYSHTVIAFSDNYLRIISLEQFGQIFHADKVLMDYIPKRMLLFEKHIAITESEGSNSNVPLRKNWVGQVAIYNPKSNAFLQKIKLEEGEICVSMCYLSCQEEEQPVTYLILGCVKNLIFHPNLSVDAPSIKVYTWDEKLQQAVFLHSTEVEGVPLVLEAWKEKVLAGVGKCLRAYEVGKKRLLRKAEIKGLGSPVNSIRTWGERIFATEVNDSFHMYKYKGREQTFYDIADDILTRYITATAILDYHTVIGADKFQNIFISRVPQNAEEDFENNPNSYRFRWQNGYLNGAPFKMEGLCSFFVGEVVTAIQKGSLASSGSEIIVYATISGTVAALCPFESREDVDFFTHLEMYMRNLTPMLAGRDQLAFRSYYSPCKGVVDGQLCEVFNKLNYEEQLEIGKHLERTPQEIQRKLQEMRNRLI